MLRPSAQSHTDECVNTSQQDQQIDKLITPIKSHNTASMSESSLKNKSRYKPLWLSFVESQKDFSMKLQ